MLLAVARRVLAAWIVLRGAQRPRPRPPARPPVAPDDAVAPSAAFVVTLQLLA